MASFAGTDLGIVTEKIPFVNPIERQVNKYPGVNGLQILQGGTRGGTIHVKGVLYANTVAALEVVEQFWDTAVANGATGTLVDDFGGSYANCIIMAFRPEGSRVDAQVKYTMEFLQNF